MEQVPRGSYGIVGSGRAATHISRYFTLLGIPFVTWSRKSAVGAESALAPADKILLLVSDSQIEPFIAQHPRLKQKSLIHFSGSLALEGIAGAHPLVSFGPKLFDREFYSSVPFVTEEGGADFGALFPELPNPSFAIPRRLKPLYHALCVMSGNFTTLLWSKFFADIEKLGLPREQAQPYLRSIFETLSAHGALALTGPISRRDTATLERNLESLAGDPYEKIFRSFMEAHA